MKMGSTSHSTDRVNLPLDKQVPPITVRRATMKDHAEILAIDASVGAYDAGDYLFGKLGMYLTDPNRMCFVGLIHGKIVGFTLNRMTGDGHNVIGRLARLEKSIRKSGAWELIRTESFSQFYEQYPLSRNFFGCTSSWKEVPAFRKGWTLRMNRTYVHISINRSVILKTTSGSPRLKTSSISFQRCYEILSDRKSHYNVFPHGMVVVGREPLIIHPMNFHLITAECKQILATHDVSSGELRTMSFGTGFHSPQAYVFEVDMYTSTGDAEEMTQHILSHIPVAKRHITSEQKLIISVFVSQKYGIQPLIDHLNSSDNWDAYCFSDVRHHVMACVDGIELLRETETRSKI